MFKPFDKIGRLSGKVFVTEKIDGTNGQIFITKDKEAGIDPIDTWLELETTEFFMYAASRNRFISVDNDNYGFAKWVKDNSIELRKLGEGQHFGEWWGPGIGPRKYPVESKRFSLFNIARWGAHNPNTPACCLVVPSLGTFKLDQIDDAMVLLKKNGSFAVPGFMNPEGIVIYYERTMFKKTFENDTGKWNAERADAQVQTYKPLYGSEVA